MKNSKCQNVKDTNQCGNCWGHQEYDNISIDKDLKYQPTGSQAFILRFVEKYL